MPGRVRAPGAHQQGRSLLTGQDVVESSPQDSQRPLMSRGTPTSTRCERSLFSCLDQPKSAVPAHYRLATRADAPLATARDASPSPPTSGFAIEASTTVLATTASRPNC